MPRFMPAVPAQTGRRLKRADGTSITNNVEYSMLDALLIATGSPDGDVAGTDGSGLSPYPGNMNQLIFKLDNYIKSLESEEPGVAKTCPEFVNPKYKDATRTGFKKPTRLECMMQDLPRLFDDGAKVGFTTIMGNGLTAEREAAIAASWGAGTDAALIKSRISFYSPVKNNVKDAAGKQRKGQVPGCAAVGETDVYAAHCKVLLALGCNIGAPLPRTYGEGDEAITANDWPHISIAPALCLTTATLQEVFPTPGQVVVASGSTLVLDGPGKVIIESLELDGALRVTVSLSVDEDFSLNLLPLAYRTGRLDFLTFFTFIFLTLFLEGGSANCKASCIIESCSEHGLFLSCISSK